MLRNIKEKLLENGEFPIFYLYKKKWSNNPLDHSVSIDNFSFYHIRMHHRIILKTGLPSLFDNWPCKETKLSIGYQFIAPSISLFEKRFKLIAYFNGDIRENSFFAFHCLF